MTLLKKVINLSRKQRSYKRLLCFHHIQKILVIVLAVLLIILLSGFYFAKNYLSINAEKSIAKVFPGKYAFHCDVNGLHIDSTDFMFDTGLSLTSFYKNNYKKFRIGSGQFMDAHNSRQKVCLYFFPKIETAPGLRLKHLIAISWDEYSALDSTICAILGMDIVKQANWHICFNNHTIEILPLKNEITYPKNALCFTYQSGNRPKINLLINGVLCKNVLIDMGLSGECELTLDKKTETTVLKQNKPSEILDATSSSFFGKTNIKVFVFDSLDIAQDKFRHVCVAQGAENSIGLGFLSRFDHLFWDSRHKKVYLWNEEEK